MLGSKIEQICGLSKIFHKSTYSNIPYPGILSTRKKISVWFNCFLSWPHRGIHWSIHLYYFFYTMNLKPTIVKYWWVRWMKAERYLEMSWITFTIAVTHKKFIGTFSIRWAQRFTSSTVRTIFHPLLLLSRFEYLVAPPWDKKWLTIGILEWLPERNWLWELPFSRFP